VLEASLDVPYARPLERRHHLRGWDGMQKAARRGLGHHSDSAQQGGPRT
jgi:hypothetical protein